MYIPEYKNYLSTKLILATLTTGLYHIRGSKLTKPIWVYVFAILKVTYYH